MINVIVIGIIGLILGTAIGYIIKEKKKGVRCMGCPDSGTCGNNCNCGTDTK